MLRRGHTFTTKAIAVGSQVRWGSIEVRIIPPEATATSASNSSSSVAAVPPLATTASDSHSSGSAEKKKSSVVTATTLHAGDAPRTIQIDLTSPDEGAARRLSQHEPKPFITPKQMRDFTFSVVVGASVMAGIHYVLSASIAENYDDEVAVLRRVTRDSSEAEKLPTKPEIPQFVAPSSYSVLKKKMEEEKRIAREKYLDAENKKETPVLHQEMWQRVMFAWNNSLANVEQSAAAMAVQYQNWRLKQMKKNIQSLVESQGLVLVDFKHL